jgi:hypothetical protein
MKKIKRPFSFYLKKLREILKNTNYFEHFIIIKIQLPSQISLPNELVGIIMNYTNVITYRHGVYINRIKKDDVRYEMLKQIKKPNILPNYKIIYITNFIIKYDFTNSLIKLKIYKVNTKNSQNYILDKNNKYCKLNEYEM